MRSLAIDFSPATVLILTLASACVGCAASTVQMYSGPGKAPTEHAVVHVASPEPAGRLEIMAVDGKKTTNFFGFMFNNNHFPGAATVLPGKHNIRVICTTKGSFWAGSDKAYVDLWWVADVGGTYVVKARFEGYSVLTWIEDERTGTTVGGITGSADEPHDQQ